MAQYYVGVDVGGTTVKMGMFSDTGELLDKWEIPTRRKNNENELLERYKKQLTFYKYAIEKTLKMPVKEVMLYSFYLEKECIYK